MILNHCILTYFNLPARGEACRLALTLANVPFTDNRISFSDWKDLKPTTPWGSLPTLKLSDGTVIAQQRAILRLIGKETGLYPSDVVAAAKVDSIMDGTEDLFAKTTEVGKNLPQKEKEEARNAACNDGGVIFTVLNNIDRMIGSSGGPFVVGSALTIADLYVYVYTSTLISGLYDGIPFSALDPFVHIGKLRMTVRSHPAVCKYYDSLPASSLPSSFGEL